jgi:peptidoglycan/xylan/chitin deacetylase (PgdA/CDA1 family)
VIVRVRIRIVVSVVLALVVTVTSSGSTQPAGRAVAFTFDDLPARGDLATKQETTAKLLRTLVAERVPAIGFVNEINVSGTGDPEAQTALLEAWLDAGFELGNHTYSHAGADSVAFDTYRADVIKGETVTKRLLEARGRRLRFFRHPSLRTGPTAEYKAALDALLAERGYRVAPVTVDNNDFMFGDVYGRARARGDMARMARIAEAYVPYMESVFTHFEHVSRTFLGYEVRQTLLLHANELNADRLGDLIGMLRRRGYRFVDLETALEDPAYRLPDAPVARGLSWLHRWMLAKGLPMQAEPAEPAFIRELYARPRR